MDTYNPCLLASECMKLDPNADGLVVSPLLDMPAEKYLAGDFLRLAVKFDEFSGSHTLGNSGHYFRRLVIPGLWFMRRLFLFVVRAPDGAKTKEQDQVPKCG
jgi:hypothetical protein